MLWTSVVLLLLLLAVTTLLARSLRSARRRWREQPGAFPCRLRVVSGVVRGLPREWSGAPGSAAWVHDALVLRPGRLTAAHVLPVRFPEGGIGPITARDVRGLGPAPSTLQLRLDDGAVVELATERAHRDRLAGPFLAACLTRSG